MNQMLLKIFNPLPDNKILALTKLEAFADDKLNEIQIIELVFHGVENIVGKGMLVTSIFPFPTMFSRYFFLRAVKRRQCMAKG